jgi:hypothetical protein
MRTPAFKVVRTGQVTSLHQFFFTVKVILLLSCLGLEQFQDQGGDGQ